VGHELNQVLKATHRARDLVRQILTFSRKTGHDREPVDAVPLVQEVLTLLRASIPSTIEIRSHFEADGFHILTNATQFHQVMMNLCTNAAHAMEETGGVLDVTLQKISLSGLTAGRQGVAPGRYLEVRVRDNGPGIAAPLRKRIFDPYFTTKDVDKGTGMGMSVVHGIVKGHEGAMEIKSQPALGTRVHVYLPVIDGALEIEYQAVQPIQGGRERILFVDDETAIAKTGCDILQRLGYQVDAFSDPVEALSAFSARPFDYHLVITDMTMPNMRGDNLARRILSIRADIAVIISSGFSENIDSSMAKALGVRGFIQKPLDKADLARAIRDALDS